MVWPYTGHYRPVQDTVYSITRGDEKKNLIRSLSYFFVNVNAPSNQIIQPRETELTTDETNCAGGISSEARALHALSRTPVRNEKRSANPEVEVLLD